jgi:hypothetical protein
VQQEQPSAVDSSGEVIVVIVEYVDGVWQGKGCDDKIDGTPKEKVILAIGKRSTIYTLHFGFCQDSRTCIVRLFD